MKTLAKGVVLRAKVTIRRVEHEATKRTPLPSRTCWPVLKRNDLHRFGSRVCRKRPLSTVGPAPMLPVTPPGMTYHGVFALSPSKNASEAVNRSRHWTGLLKIGRRRHRRSEPAGQPRPPRSHVRDAPIASNWRPGRPRRYDARRAPSREFRLHPRTRLHERVPLAWAITSFAVVPRPASSSDHPLDRSRASVEQALRGRLCGRESGALVRRFGYSSRRTHVDRIRRLDALATPDASSPASSRIRQSRRRIGSSRSDPTRRSGRDQDPE